VPDTRDRDAFLAAVRSRLDLPDTIAHDVLEELVGHLEDAATELRAAGLSAADAERRAIGRLGDPGALGTDLAQARRGGRRLLAAVGGGIRAVIVEGIRTWIFLWLALGLAAVLALPAASVLLHLIGRSTSSYLGGPLGNLVTVSTVAQGAVTEAVTTLRYSLPRLRNPIMTTTFVIGIAPDGRRVVISAKMDLIRTPPWTGTLVEWWTGN
jgi:hypothetical protein